MPTTPNADLGILIFWDGNAERTIDDAPPGLTRGYIDEAEIVLFVNNEGDVEVWKGAEYMAGTRAVAFGDTM